MDTRNPDENQRAGLAAGHAAARRGAVAVGLATMGRRRFLTVGAAVAAGALTLPGCTTEPDTGSSSPTTPTTDLPSTGWRAAARDDVQDGGTLNLAVDNVPANWNTNNADSGTVDDTTLASLFVPSFITLDDTGVWSADPTYADRVELVSESPQVVEIDIAQAASWSDGTPITAADVAANWNALNGVTAEFAPNATNIWEDIASVEQGATEKNVVITFAKVNVDWPAVLGQVYPAWLMATPESFNTAWQTGPYAPDGTTYVSGGPYVLASFDANGGVATFTRNPAWWGDPPKLETVVFKVVSRDSLAQAFGNREVDAFNLNGSADNLRTVEGRDDATVLRSLGPVYRHVTLNGTSGVFATAAVREAFATALDREVLAAAILSPVESPAATLGNLIYLPGQKGYVDHAEALNGDVDAARSILEGAGATFDGDAATLDGAPLAVRFVIPSDNQNSANIANLVQQQTARAGFAVTIDTVPSADFFVSYINTSDRDFDATYFAWQGTPFPISSSQSIYYPADAGQNYSGVTDDSLGADWEAANAEFDADARVDLANGIDEKLVALHSTVPLFAEPYAYGAVTSLANYGPALFEPVRWQDVGFTA